MAQTISTANAGQTVEKLASTDITSSTTNYEFTNISQSYTHLAVKIYGYSETASSKAITITINNNSGSIYSTQTLHVTSTPAISSAQYLTSPFIDYNSIFGGADCRTVYSELEWLNYTDTSKYKIGFHKITGPTNTNTHMIYQNNVVQVGTASAITSIQFALSNFTTNASGYIALYGIKKA